MPPRGQHSAMAALLLMLTSKSGTRTPCSEQFAILFDTRCLSVHEIVLAMKTSRNYSLRRVGAIFFNSHFLRVFVWGNVRAARAELTRPPPRKPNGMRSRLPKKPSTNGNATKLGLGDFRPRPPPPPRSPPRSSPSLATLSCGPTLKTSSTAGSGRRTQGREGVSTLRTAARRKLPRTTGFGGGSTSPSSVSGVRLHGNGRHRGGRRSLPGLHGPSPCGRSWRRTARLYPGTGIQRAIAPNI